MTDYLLLALTASFTLPTAATPHFYGQHCLRKRTSKLEEDMIFPGATHAVTCGL
jgi:hypothetical protein